MIHIEEITEYCLTECRLLSKQMTQLRECVFQIGLEAAKLGMDRALGECRFSKRKACDTFRRAYCGVSIFPSNRIGRITPLLAGGSKPETRYLKSGALACV